MIKIRDANVKDLLPFFMNDNEEIAALSYAINLFVKKICDYAEKANAIVNLENASNEMLNSLCLELNIPCFHENDNAEIKRKLIKEAFLWHSMSGTPAALLKYFKMININAEIQEWYEYQGLPYHFRIIGNANENQEITDETIQDVEKQVNRLKNARSLLDETVIIKPESLSFKSGEAIGVAVLPEIKITADYENSWINSTYLTDLNGDILTDKDGNLISL